MNANQELYHLGQCLWLDGRPRKPRAVNQMRSFVTGRLIPVTWQEGAASGRSTLTQ